MISRYWRNLAALCVFGLVGCPLGDRSGIRLVSRPLEGQEVELAAPSSLNLPGLWEVILQEWQSQTGARTKFVEFKPQEDSSQQPLPEPGIGGRLVIMPLTQFCEIEPQLAPLTNSNHADRNDEFDARDLFKGLRERVLSRESQLIASPISVPVLVCYYRKDLLRAANRKPPETWAEYHELVADLNSWGPGLVASEPLSPAFRATTFFAKSLAFCKHPENYSVWFDVDTGVPTLTSPGFIEALETAHRTWSKLPPEVMSYDPADCRNLMLSGKAAIALSFEPHTAELAPHSPNDASNQVHRVEGIEIGVCRLPGSRRVFNRNSKKWDKIPSEKTHAPALCGFAGLVAGVVIPAANRNVDTGALNLLVSLSKASMFDQAFAALPKGPCRESQLSLAPNWFGPDLSAEEASEYYDATALSLRDSEVVFELPLIGAAEFRRAASDALDPLLRGDSDPQKTLLAMQQAFESIIERHGRELVRDSHRRGLGLSPAFKK